MLVLLSPSKSFTQFAYSRSASQPVFKEQAVLLQEVLLSKGADHFQKLNALKDRASQEAWNLIEAWVNAETWPAAWTYSGETFFGLGAYDMNAEALKFAEDSVRILSGLYGVLRPEDAIAPYRLEMQSKLSGEWGGDLYAFWGSKLAQDVENKASGAVIALASGEMMKAVLPHMKNVDVITPKFVKLNPDGKTKQSFPKFSRGLMARWICENQVSDQGKLTDFNLEGYSYSEELSSSQSPVFVAPESFTLKGRFKKSA